MAREWRVVQVPEEDARITDISTLFTRILDHVYDPLEPTEMHLYVLRLAILRTVQVFKAFRQKNPGCVGMAGSIYLNNK